MPDDDSVRIELDEGELISMPPAGGRHGYCESKITLLLGVWVEQHQLGRIYTSDTGFRLNAGTVRAPDLSFVRAQRVPEVHRDGFLNGAPDLAMEIFSPSDSVRQLMRKTKWIVYQEQREVNVLEASGADRLLVETDKIDAPELLPGFSGTVAEFFGD
jgi:Uma2 family endonuclease